MTSLPPKVTMSNSPRVFLTLEKTHDTPHLPFKELAANARDGQASNFEINVDMIEGQGVLIIRDDGQGPIFEGAEAPNFESFHQMMNMGHSLSHANNKKIGEAGTGFKRGVLGIARNTVVVTQDEEYFYIALFSASVHEDILRTQPYASETEIPCMVRLLPPRDQLLNGSDDRLSCCTQIYDENRKGFDTTDDAFRWFDKHTAFRGECVVAWPCLKFSDPVPTPADCTSSQGGAQATHQAL